MILRLAVAALGLIVVAPARHGDKATAPVRRLVPVAAAESLAVFASGASANGTAALRAPVTVVFLPGSLGSAFAMRHLTSALSVRDVPTVVIDLLGMGTSPRPINADYSLSRQASRIRAVLDSLHVQRAVVVAVGNGATVALHLAAEDPERIAAILSLAGGVVEQQATRGIRLALSLSFLLDNPVGRAIGRRRFEGAMREQSVDPAWITREVMQKYMEPFEHDLRGTLRTLRAMNDAVESKSIASRLPTVRAPMHLLVGDKPSTSSPSDAQIDLLQRSLRHFTVDTVARSGIMLHEERPDNVVASILTLLRAENPAGR